MADETKKKPAAKKEAKSEGAAEKPGAKPAGDAPHAKAPKKGATTKTRRSEANGPAVGVGAAKSAQAKVTKS